GDALEDGDALLRRRVEEGGAVRRVRQRVDARQALSPQFVLERVVLDLRILLGERAIDVSGDAGGARAARVLVGGDDHLGELVEEAELGGSEEEARCGGSGR